MLARCASACALGLDGAPTEVEVHFNRSANPRFDVVGLPDAAGREARDRVRAALVNSGYRFPSGRLLVNLAPADTRKVGPVHDLPMALGILTACGTLPLSALRNRLVFGELALDGRLRPVRRAFLLASVVAQREADEVLVPEGNGAEAALAAGVPVVTLATLRDAVLHVTGESPAPVAPSRAAEEPTDTVRDFREIRGQAPLKTALTVAAAGGHNVLLVGPPGAGKTLAAERFPDLLPPLDTHEALEVARLRSAAGLPVPRLPVRRPFRAPSCGASAAGLLGGGQPPGPGEVSLAHRGVLFLDEFPHFRGDALEGLRQPLEDGKITISRAGRHVTLPARVQLIAAMNPCPCGHADTPRCDCTPLAQQRYAKRLSGPLLDRVDMRIAVPAVSFADLRRRSAGDDTASMRARVIAATAVQTERLGVGRRNADLRPTEIERWCVPDAAGRAQLESACDSGLLTARGVARVLRVSRTLADLDGATGPEIAHAHLVLALHWRVDAVARSA